MNAFFTELGEAVSARWKAENFSLAAFPKIARDVLTEQPPSEKVALDELVRDFLLDDQQPFQTSSGFGQPELIVYDDPRFYIQILVWMEGTTDIHQHEFSGAFHVMAGSSIHAHFDFNNAQSVSAHLRVGDLEMKTIELLEEGDTIPIISGKSCIHSLFHLDMPSITVVIRTHHDPGTGPQYTYLPPHIAVDPNHHDALTMRRKQLLDMLERTENPAYGELVAKMIEDLDFERGFFILQNGLGYLQTHGAWESALEAFQKKHGELAKGVGTTLEEIVRRDRMAAFRSSITEAEHRFFIALLLNVPTREEILNMISKRYSDDPIETVLKWAEELMDYSEDGVSILDAQFPRSAKVSEEEQPDVFLAGLRHFLEGEEGPLEDVSPKNLKALREAVQKSSFRVLLP